MATVTSVTEGQNFDAAQNAIDTYEIAFTVDGGTGTYTTTVPQSGDPVAAARAAIDAKEAEVRGILALS